MDSERVESAKLFNFYSKHQPFSIHMVLLVVYVLSEALQGFPINVYI